MDNVFSYVHTQTHTYVTNMAQQNTEKLAGSISQENSFKVYFSKGNLRHFTCFITL